MAIELDQNKQIRPPGQGLIKRLQGLLPLRQDVSAKQKMFFLERLSLLLETGGAIYPSLVLLASQEENPLFTAIINDVAQEVLGGNALSQALSCHPGVFSSNYVYLVKAGEKGGFLPQVLRQLCVLEEKRDMVRHKIMAAALYPAGLLIFTFFVILFILLVVFPKFGTLFGSIRQELPFTTRFLLQLSEILKHYWFFMLLAAGILLIGLAYLVSLPACRRLLDRGKLRLPLLRTLFVQVYLIQVLRVMSLSLGNGVPIVETLRSCRGLVANYFFQEFIAVLEENVVEGRGIACGFEQQQFIPPLVSQMVKTGEQGGNLAYVTERIAEFYERELERTIVIFSKTIEPLLLLLVGGIVGTVVAALILPIFKLSRAVH